MGDRSIRLVGLALALLLTTCGGGGGEPDPGAGEAVLVSPTEAAPGETVRVVLAEASPSGGDGVTVTIEDRAARVVRVLRENEIEVLVPDLPSGPASVVAVERGRVLGTAGLVVLRPVARTLVLSVTDDGLNLLRTERAHGSWWEKGAGSGRRLAYDVVSPAGGLVFTGAVVHPVSGRREVFGDPEPGRVHRVDDSAGGICSFKIPNVAGTLTVRLYDAPEGVDLDTEEGRAARRLIGEIAAPAVE